MNIQKMRKQVYRKIPDTTERTFDPMSETFHEDYNKWCHSFLRDMKAKHGNDLQKVHITQHHTDFGHSVRIELSAQTS